MISNFKFQISNIRPRIVISFASLLAVIGCSSSSNNGSGAPAAQLAFGTFPHVQKTGAQIWAENCTRCHIPRPATQYSERQWDAITTHMRLRCNLNGEEQRAVYRFMTGQ